MTGYKDAKFQDGLESVCRSVNIENVQRRDLHIFVMLSKCWIVDRTIAWINRWRCFAKDWGC